MAGDPTWYVPVCDRVLAKVQLWFDIYDRGDESASRKWITMNARIVDRTTMYAHRIKWKATELDHLIRLLDALAEHQELTSDFKRVREGLHHGRLLPNGEREVVLNFYKADVAEVLDVLRRAKSGKLLTLDQTAQKQTEAGKGMFEI